MKKFIFAVVSLFILFMITGYLIHGVILKDMYMQTASLWRPLPEMKNWLLQTSTIVHCIIFVWLYSMMSKKSIGAGIKFGFLFGIAYGFGMGYGTYSTMPIPLYLANAWFIGSVIETTLAGLVTGLIIK